MLSQRERNAGGCSGGRSPWHREEKRCAREISSPRRATQRHAAVLVPSRASPCDGLYRFSAPEREALATEGCQAHRLASQTAPPSLHVSPRPLVRRCWCGGCGRASAASTAPPSGMLRLDRSGPGKCGGRTSLRGWRKQSRPQNVRQPEKHHERCCERVSHSTSDRSARRARLERRRRRPVSFSVWQCTL